MHLEKLRSSSIDPTCRKACNCNEITVKEKAKKRQLSLFLLPTSSLSLSLSPALFASNLLLLHEKRPKELSAPAEAPPRLSHTTSLSSEIKTVHTLHTITLFLLTRLLTNTNNSHKSHKHKPNERTTAEPTNKQHPENTSPPSPPQLQTKPNPQISHTTRAMWTQAKKEKKSRTLPVWTGKFTVLKWRKAKATQIPRAWTMHIHCKLEIEKSPFEIPTLKDDQTTLAKHTLIFNYVNTRSAFISRYTEFSRLIRYLLINRSSRSDPRACLKH